MSEYMGVDYLRRKLNEKQTRIKKRYAYYEMKNITRDFGISTPPDLRMWMSCLGWCGKAVDTLADRLVFEGFSEDTFGLNEIYQANNADILHDSAVLSALICSCSFIYITPDVNDPRMRVIDGYDATGVIDPTTGLLKEGYAVLERDAKGKATIEAYFEPYKVTYIYNEDGTTRTETIDHKAPAPLLVPIIYRPDAKRPFGHSRISRACMSIVGSAVRTVKRSEISAEFFSFPQKYITGLSPEAEIENKWASAMSAMLAMTKDEEGDSPKIGQFAQQSMAPHLEQLRMFASLFAGETGLTVDDLGFTTGNPASAEAIKSAHEALRLTARKAQRTFGSGFLNAGYLASCIRDDYEYSRTAFALTRPMWAPVFEPDSSMLSGIGDALIKIEQSHPGYITNEKMRELTGF